MKRDTASVLLDGQSTSKTHASARKNVVEGGGILPKVRQVEMDGSPSVHVPTAYSGRAVGDGQPADSGWRGGRIGRRSGG